LEISLYACHTIRQEDELADATEVFGPVGRDEEHQSRQRGAGVPGAIDNLGIVMAWGR
jgi:hypothetical protein